MNSFTMAVHTVLEAVSTLLHAGDTTLYLLLTCVSVLFSVLFIFRRRKEKAGESSLRWMPASGISLDPIISSQSSTTSLTASSTQDRNTEITQDCARIHRMHRHQCQQSEFFPSSRFNENTFDSSINGKLQCNNWLEPTSHWRNETDINQHQLWSNSCELLYQGIIDSEHSDVLPQCCITDDSHTDELSRRSASDASDSGELFQPAITDSSHKDELSRGGITDASHKDELTQGGITDLSHKHELFQSTVADTSQKDELSQGGITNSYHKDELSQGGITDSSQQREPFQRSVADTSHKDELSQRGITDSSYKDELSQGGIIDSSHKDELIQHSFADTSKTDEPSQGGITDSSHVDELLQRSNTDSSHTDELLQRPITDSSHQNELLQRHITDASDTDKLLQRPITDVPHADKMLQCPITDSSHKGELLQYHITDSSHTDELLQRPVTDSSHTGELLQHPTPDSYTNELFQCPILDTSHTDELFQCPIPDTSYTDELFQCPILDTSHTDELFQCPILGTSHTDELSQPVISDPYFSLHQRNSHKYSSSKHAQAGAITTSNTLCDSGQDINNIHCEKLVEMDHQREIIHVLTDHNKHNKYHKEIRLYNKEKACKGEPEPVDTMLTCNLDNVQHKLFWRQLSLDSRHLRRSHVTSRYSSASNVAPICENHTRELRIRQHDCVLAKSSCKNKAASEDIVQTSSVRDLPNIIHTSSNIYCADAIPDSKRTSMSKRADINTNPDFNQEICYQQEKANSEFPGDTCQTLMHSLPLSSKYSGVCYNSERRPSLSDRNMSTMVCQRLNETTPQRSGHTTLGKSCSHESVPIQTSCAIENNIAADHVIPLDRDRINNVNQTSASAAILYGNPEQRQTNWRLKSLQVKGQGFPDNSHSVNSPDSVPEICPNHRHPQTILEPDVYRHDLGKIQSEPENTSTSITTQQIQLRRKRWGKSFFTPTERSQSTQLDFMSRPLSLPVPVISQSNDSLTRRATQKLVSLGDMQQHLSRHTKGIFRKRVSVSNMLTWSKDPIQKPMIRSKDKSIRREACEIFKMIQTYMGDRKGKQTQMSLALDVVTRGWAMPSLRDEIYVQLMRQTTDNKRDESLRCGWELLALCLYFFPPTPKFNSCLESYISQPQEPFSNSDSIPSPEMSANCLRRLKRAQKIGTKLAVHKPTLEELENAKATIFSPTMFGNMLEDVMLLQKERYPDRQLPWIQTVLCEEILRLHGTQTEGIFRVSSDIDEVNNLKAQCDKWILPTDCTDPHVPASLLKLWYRELFEPLIPAQFYQACVDNFSNAEAAIAIVYQLPRLNHLVLCYLIRFLQLFASPGNVAHTKMDVNNLAMVMAPNCLRYESEDLLTIYENVQKEMGFVRTLIRYLDTSFMEGIV